MNNVEKIKAEIERRYEYWKEKESNSHSIESESRMSECQHLLLLFNSLQEEPVSNDLEEAAKIYEEDAIFYAARRISDYFKAGAQWQKKQMIAKACEWLENYFKGVSSGTVYLEDFKKAIKE